ncbi:MAG: DsrE family protein [Nitrospirae bacterium]|nr:DsrE family protein [Nitrospirota bacterium]
MKIGFLLHKSPEHQDAHTVKKLAEAFVKGGHETSIFLMEDGIYNAINPITGGNKRLSPGFDILLSKGVKIAMCTHTADLRGIERTHFIKGVDFHSQYDLSVMIKECDRFLSFV